MHSHRRHDLPAPSRPGCFGFLKRWVQHRSFQRGILFALLAVGIWTSFRYTYAAYQGRRGEPGGATGGDFGGVGAGFRKHVHWPWGTSSQNSSALAGYEHLTATDLTGSSDIALIVKTGATVAIKRVPPHGLTTFNHVENYALFSDMAQKIGPYQLHDALESFNQTLISSLDDFKIYRKLKSYKEWYRSPDDGPKLEGAWELDKYKNIHVAHKAYNIFPDKKWYVFIDADTYILWHNVVMWLRRLDEKKPWYIGAPALFADEEFGHGGSGYIVSQEAMRKTVGMNPSLAAEYEEKTTQSCCGDHMFGKAMHDHGVKLTNGWPLLNGETFYSMYVERDSWCRPMITLHRMLPIDILEMWEFEKRNATSGRAITWNDVFSHFVEPTLFQAEQRVRWDNMSDGKKFPPDEDQDQQKKADEEKAKHEQEHKAESDEARKLRRKRGLSKVEKVAHESLENCKKACEDVWDCLQYRWKKGECWINWTVRLGKKELSEDGNVWNSGWFLDRIRQQRKEALPCKETGAVWIPRK